MTKQQIEQLALEQLSRDLSCSPNDFMKEENTIVKSSIINGRREFFKQKNFLRMATFGYGTVISVEDRLYEWAKEYFHGISGLECFSNRHMSGIDNILDKYGKTIAAVDLHNYYLPNPDKLVITDKSIELKWFEREEISGLYGDKRFVNALMYDTTRSRYDILAVAAIHDSNIIGLAGASTDSDLFWQIGIDVMPEYKNKGIAAALVSAITDEILKRGAIPYYGAVTANIASRRVANKCGYYPAWIEYWVL